MKYSLGATLIVKDETTEIENCLRSIRDYVDEIFVGVTGGDVPETRRILKKYKCKTIDIKWRNDFSYARNIVHNFATTDLVFFIDADDTLEFTKPMKADEFRKEIDKIFTDNTSIGAIWSEYKYQYDDHGNCTFVHLRERIIKKSFYKWEGRLHELCKSKYKMENTKFTSFYIKHHASNERISKSAERNLIMSQESYEEEKKAKTLVYKTAFDFARSLGALRAIKSNDQTFSGPQLAIPIYQETLGLAETDNDRVDIYNRLSGIYKGMAKYIEAMEYASLSIKLKPSLPDGDIALGNIYFDLNNWKEASACYIASLSKQPNFDFISTDPTKYQLKVYKQLALCYFYMELVDKAKAYCDAAMKLDAEDEQMLVLDEHIKNAMYQIDLTNQFLNIKIELEKQKEESKLKSLSDSVPSWMSDQPFAVRLKNTYNPVIKNNRLVIFCGESNTPWGPGSVMEGIGGSEEAVIYLSRELAKLGWNVDVYNSCNKVDEYDGVKYIPFWSYDPKEKCDIFISWRDIGQVKIAPENSKKYLWLHDVTSEDKWNIDIEKMLDKVFFLSKYHRTNLPNLPDNKVFYTGNAIDPAHFKEFEDVKKIKNRCIYVSSPDRGLEFLLEMWKDIRTAIPDATLNIYYGFETWDYLHRGDEVYAKRKEAIVNKLKELESYGVSWVGKVGHMELAHAMSQAEYWLYPCGKFNEVYCISAKKVIASRCLAITTNMGSLDEICDYGIKVHTTMEEGSKVFMDKYKNIVIDRMKLGLLKEDIKDLKDNADRTVRDYSWTALAKQWDKLFKEKK